MDKYNVDSVSSKRGFIETTKYKLSTTFSGKITYIILALMWSAFIVQTILPTTIESQIFYFTTEDYMNVWTWVTSVFAHGSFGHILSNSFVIFFFGQIAERKLGSLRYTLFFIITGVIAGIMQIGTMIAFGSVGAVIGASGAGLAIMGLLTAWNPNLRVYLFFAIPIPIWIITIGFFVVSALSALTGGAGANGVAQIAHLGGVVIGYGIGKIFHRNLRSNMGLDVMLQK